MKPLNQEQQAAQTAVLIKRLIEEMRTPAYTERNTFMALDRRNRYLAHIEAGFTEQQALELVK